MNDAVPPAAWLLGSTFAVRDLVCYAAGVAVALVADVLAGRSAARRAARGVPATPSARTSG